uniref:RNA-dependent RNA polymerase n=1 Tax=Grapevine-associated botourmia-like virus 4 TaxID=2814348 RepID=A0A8F5MJH4_9VIRU|nr:MAG: RNA-dependent RNA polymerase [Grapevine-associated botourmia-like virus 4]
MVDPRFFSVNSSFFRSHRRRKPSLVPVLRVASLAKEIESVSGFGSALRRFCLGFTGEQRERAETMFLRKRAYAIRSTGRSVIRGLGMKVSVVALQSSGLWRRECWYAELPMENPLPEDPSRLRWAGVPEGWTREPFVPSKGRRLRRAERLRRDELQSAFVRELVDSAWRGGAPAMGTQVKDYRRAVERTGYEESFRQWVKNRKRVTRPFQHPVGFGGVGPCRKPGRLFAGIKPPTTSGSGKVRRWISDGVPCSMPGAGVGAVARWEKVWQPVQPEAEETNGWVDCAPWEDILGCTYEQFILGVTL